MKVAVVGAPTVTQAPPGRGTRRQGRAPGPALVWTVLAGFYLVLALPLAAALLAPLWSRGWRAATVGVGEIV